MFQYTAKQRTIRKSEKIKKIWLTGKGARDATASKKNGAAEITNTSRPTTRQQRWPPPCQPHG